MTSTDRRKHPRIPVMLDAEIRRGQWYRFTADHISQSGIFIRTSYPFAVAELIRLRVFLGDEPPLEVMALVKHFQSLGLSICGGHLPGIGLELFRLSEDARSRWESFISQANAEESACQ